MFFSLTSRATDGGVKFSGIDAETWKVVECPFCHARNKTPEGVVTVKLATNQGRYWPDIFQGVATGLCISDQVKEALDMAGFSYGATVSVSVIPPFPKRLVEPPPRYSMILGEIGAGFDFGKAGMAVKRRCPNCGKVERETKTPIQEDFIKNTWSGMDIFVTDLSPYAFFCTGRIVDLARKHRWMGFCFIPLEQAHDYTHPGIEYLSE